MNKLNTKTQKKRKEVNSCAGGDGGSGFGTLCICSLCGVLHLVGYSCPRLQKIMTRNYKRKKQKPTTKTQTEIEKAVKDWSKAWFTGKFIGEGAATNFEKFLIQKLEHLAKQKDEEFLGIIGEDEKRPRDKENPGFMKYEIRNNFRDELRNKLQKGKE